MNARSQRLVWPVLMALLAVGAGGYVLARPAARSRTPLAIDSDGIDGPQVIRDRQGREIIRNVRTVEKGLLYRGSAFPTSFGSAGRSEYADETAFEFLRSRNVRHVLALVDRPETFYAEQGYLQYWSGKTGFEIGTTWVPIDPSNAYGRDDRSGLRAAAVLIALMRERDGEAGAVYVHDLDGLSHAAVAAAGYELWRNRGWNSFDSTWTLVERRFMSGNHGRHLRSLRSIREDLRFVIEL